MGSGNWRPDAPARHNNPETVRGQFYLEILDLQEDHDELAVEFAYDELKAAIENALPPSFSKPTDRQNSDWFGGGFSVNTRALFWNRQVLVVWDTKGDTHHQGVGVVVNPDAYQYNYSGLAEHAARTILGTLLLELGEVYPGKISMWTSPWTTAKAA